MLEERAQQFRAIERRLLTRFKDKTPAPLVNLDTLLEGTYRQLLALADHIEENNRYKYQCEASLAATTKTINMLVRFWQGLNDTQSAILDQAITTTVNESSLHVSDSCDVTFIVVLYVCLNVYLGLGRRGRGISYVPAAH